MSSWGAFELNPACILTSKVRGQVGRGSKSQVQAQDRDSDFLLLSGVIKMIHIQGPVDEGGQC